MDWKAWLKTATHVAVQGAVITAAGALSGGGPITSKTVLLPALAGAAAAVWHLFSPPPNAQ